MAKIIAIKYERAHVTIKSLNCDYFCLIFAILY